MLKRLAVPALVVAGAVIAAYLWQSRELPAPSSAAADWERETRADAEATQAGRELPAPQVAA